MATIVHHLQPLNTNGSEVNNVLWKLRRAVDVSVLKRSYDEDSIRFKTEFRYDVHDMEFLVVNHEQKELLRVSTANHNRFYYSCSIDNKVQGLLDDLQEKIKCG